MNFKGKVDNYFHVSERGSSISTELIGGATTFATMAYILIYMTSSMGVIPGLNQTGVLLCTALITALAILSVGFYANLPICLAPVLVIPNLVANMVNSGDATYAICFGLVFLSGIAFVLISLFNLRDMFARSLPKNLKFGLGAAVGVLIVRIGLGQSGLVNGNCIGFGDFSQKSTVLGLIGLVIALVLTYVTFKGKDGKMYKIQGSLLISIILTTIIGLFMGVVSFPKNIFTHAAFSSIGDTAFKLDILGALKLKYLPFVLMLLINDFFGTTGSGLALAGKANHLDKDGNFPQFGKLFIVDSSFTVIGSIFGLTTISTFAESAAGIGSGSRTGLSNVSTAFFFLLCMFIAPLFLMIPGAATGAALIIVGLSMLETLANVDFTPEEFVPVGAMMMVTAFMFDYVGGIVIGMFIYVLIQILKAIFHKDATQIPNVPVWILTALMALYFVF
ncbi:MAG: NCS2 family permease [Sphaerochaetaceae bacterium]|nr:NCS2 family permease [Sphaerochaetaceae bacterium]